MDYLISYRPRLALGRKHLKVISYTTPVIKIGSFDWIIVVEKSPLRKLGRRAVYPMWRRSDCTADGQFPIEWKDMQSWVHFNLSDRQNLGLPRALRKGYKKYQEFIMKHASLDGGQAGADRGQTVH